MKFNFLNFKIFKVLFILLSTFYLLNSSSVLADVLGQAVQFSVNPEYEYLQRSQIGAALRKISDKAYWYVSDDYWAGISESEKNLFLSRLDELASEFDSRIYPIQTQFWGSEPKPGIDNDLRTTIFITRLIDQAGGYFDTSHLYKKTDVPESNEREMVFLSAGSIINGRAKVFLAHEFQHLIGFNQKDILRGASEDIWLNEIRAEYAPRLLGYDDVYENSNIRRRVFAFEQTPSDPLAEWQNLGSDYGAAALFMFYLVDHYGEKIISDSQRTSEIGIESLNRILLSSGFTESFSDIFSNWTIANVLNDETVNPRFAYKFTHLKNLRISSNQSYSLSGTGDLVSILNTVKDWQPVWYEFNTPVNTGVNLNLKIEFSADPATKFRIPYIAFKINGQKDIGFVPINGASGELFVKNFGSEVYKVVLIPANHSKTSNFTKNDSASRFTIRVQMTSEFEEAVQAPTPIPSVSVQASIQNLLDQISALQKQIAQLKKQTPSLPASPAPSVLSRDLFFGSQGGDVSWLQEFLIEDGVYPEARITGFFGPLTKTAVIRFQKKYGIFPQIGYVGSKTRMKVRELTQPQ
ncbi:MAG: peptidoglycan-binding protein [Parcubacteria group bacterium]|nr:peptidoglycan-binding protein [Parcubacteria group bacterium]